jgi:hypothetical protein
MTLFDNQGREVVSNGADGAPADAEYVLASADAGLPNARVLTPLGPVSVDMSVAGQIKITVDDYVGADGVTDGVEGLVPSADALDAKNVLTGDGLFSTVSELLDYLVGAAAQGDLLYRNGTVWTRLPAGTSGQFLKTLGAAADPAWAAAPARGLTTITILSGSGTFTPQAGTAYMHVELVGPGGGGGGCSGNAANAAAAGGGGSGGRVLKVYLTNPGAVAYSIGTGGAGGASGANNGSNGSGASTFDTLSAGAGSGGAASAFGAVAAAVDGGAGGAASGGDANTAGEPGTAGITLSGTVAISGMGGSIAPTGSGGNGRTTAGNGVAGAGTGAGGGGGMSTSANQSGGAGTNGTGIVLEYG